LVLAHRTTGRAFCVSAASTFLLISSHHNAGAVILGESCWLLRNNLLPELVVVAVQREFIRKIDKLHGRVLEKLIDI
jgi:hypothetical protein